MPPTGLAFFTSICTGAGFFTTFLPPAVVVTVVWPAVSVFFELSGFRAMYATIAITTKPASSAMRARVVIFGYLRLSRGLAYCLTEAAGGPRAARCRAAGRERCGAHGAITASS